MELKFLPLRGYLQNNKDYQLAKAPAVSGWDSADYKGMTEEEIGKHLANKGWIGLKIPSGKILVDVDDSMTGEMLYNALQCEGLSFDAIRTPHGYQFFFADTEKISKQSVKSFTQCGLIVDYRLHEKGYIVFPTKNTKNREFIKKADSELSPIPSWLEPVVIDNAKKFEIPLCEGGRNTTIHDHLWRLLGQNIDPEDACSAIEILNTYFTQPPLDDTELERTCLSAIEGFKRDGEVRLTDEGGKKVKKRSFIDVAKVILKKFPCFCDGKEIYVYFNGCYRGGFEEFLKAEIQKEFGGDCSSNSVNEAFNWICRDRYVRNIDSTNNDGIINVSNGLLDLNKMMLMVHRPERISITQLPVIYNPAAECPQFLKFLSEVVPESVVPIIQEMLGYLLFPDCRLEKAFLLTGGGCNGKSTLLSGVKALLGAENCSNVSLQAIDDSRFARYRLQNKITNIDDDLPAKALKESSEFKKIVSGSVIEIERKGKDFYAVKPVCKLIFAANNVPETFDDSKGFWRRWVVINFAQDFSGRADPNLIYKLTTPSELSGILNFAIQGYQRLIANNKFSECTETLEAAEQWRSESNNVSQFISECCVIGAVELERTDLFVEYQSWCSGALETPVGRNTFYNRIRKLEGVTEKKTETSRVFVGISVRKTDPEARF